jgi:hypothetical protein
MVGAVLRVWAVKAALLVESNTKPTGLGATGFADCSDEDYVLLRLEAANVVAQKRLPGIPSTATANLFASGQLQANAGAPGYGHDAQAGQHLALPRVK